MLFKPRNNGLTQGKIIIITIIY